MGNPCPVLVGMGVGIMDAFPVLGAGTVLIPWAVVEVVMGKWKNSVDISRFISDLHPYTPVFGGTPDERTDGAFSF